MSNFLARQGQVINYSALLTHQNLPMENNVKRNEVIGPAEWHSG